MSGTSGGYFKGDTKPRRRVLQMGKNAGSDSGMNLTGTGPYPLNKPRGLHMGAFRVALSGLMGLVLLASVAIAGFRSGSEMWFRSLYTSTVGVLLLSTMAMKFVRRPGSAFWFGFSLFGWSYLVLGLGLTPKAYFVVDEVGNQPLVNEFLLTTTLLTKLYVLTRYYSHIEEIGKYGYSVAIGHLILTWLLAAVGGLAALKVAGGDRAQAGDPPALRTASGRAMRTGRAVWTLAVFAVCLPVLIPILRQPKGPYFAKWDFLSARIDWLQLRMEVSRVLEAMGEPSLLRPPRRYEHTEVYRFLALDGSTPPMCVRVENNGRSVTLRYVVLDGIRPESTGAVAVDRQAALRPDEWARLTRYLESAGYWKMKETEDRSEFGSVTTFVVEGLREGHHRVIMAQNMRSFALRELCEYMTGLTGFGLQ
jgi:hypothetical protein